MNNWKVVIQDTEEDQDEHVSNRRTIDDNLMQQYGSLHLNTMAPPTVPDRPPKELIYKTSSNLLQFLSISDNVRADHLLSHEPSIENLRSSMMGPRQLPEESDTNSYYTSLSQSVSMTQQLPQQLPQASQSFSQSFSLSIAQPFSQPLPQLSPQPLSQPLSQPHHLPPHPLVSFSVRKPKQPPPPPPPRSTSVFTVQRTQSHTQPFTQSYSQHTQHTQHTQPAPQLHIQPSPQPLTQPPPYPIDDELDDLLQPSPTDDDLNLPVLPPPVEMQQYESHQRVLSSILDSTGVSILDQLEDFDMFDTSPDTPSAAPLTPTKQKRHSGHDHRHHHSQDLQSPQLLQLPSLEPMAIKKTPSMLKTLKETPTSILEKPLPNIPSLSPQYHGEYSKNDIEPVVLSPEPVPKQQVQLPDLPFSASFLQSRHFKACANPTFLSNVWKWCCQLPDWFPSQSISLVELEKSLFGLFKFQVPQLSDIILEAIANDVLNSLQKSGNIEILGATGTTDTADNIVAFADLEACGVLPSLRDCYSAMNHIFPTPYRCYSHICTYERLNYSVIPLTIQTSNMILGDDWVSHWKLTKDQLEDINKRVQIQQSHIFDLIKSVRSFINAGKVLLEVFGDGFLKNKQYFGNEHNVNWDKFYEDAFGTVRTLNQVTRETLFEPLIQKLNDDGKFVTGVSEIFQNWLNEVQIPLLLYAEKRVPVYNLIMSESNLKYSKFTEWITRTNLSVSRDYTSERLFSVQFLSFFTTLKVTLFAILKKTDEADPEHRSLLKVLRNLDSIMKKSDKTQADLEKKIVINGLKRKLVLKFKETNQQVDLDLDNQDREVYKIGNLIRKRDILHRILNDTPVTVILLDNYLLIGEDSNSNNGNYKITELPIHLSYLYVENKLFEESSTPFGSKSPKRGTGGTGGAVSETASYCFRILHPTKSINYVFETEELEEKSLWLAELMKLKLNINLTSNKFEPFKLTTIADLLLGIDIADVSSFRQLLPPNDNIRMAIQDMDSELGRIEAVSKILSFNRFKYAGKRYILLGTTNGLFMNNIGKPRLWKKVLDLKNVSQVEVVEEFGLVFLLNDKSLSYYFLDQFMKSEKLVGEKLSKRDVSFFRIGKQNGVTMIFYMKPKQSSSYFKVLIPILEKSTKKVESFQEYKKFYVPGDCTDLTILNSTFVVHTKKNFEVMSLSILYPQSIPDLSSVSSEIAPGVEKLKKTLNQPHLKPLGMFKLINNLEFLLVYNRFAMFVNKSGTISKDRLLKFSIKAHKVYFVKNLLVISNDHFIEVWYVNNTKKVNYQLVQVISAQNLRMISDNKNRGLFSMIHPQHPERQLVLTLQPKFK